MAAVQALQRRSCSNAAADVFRSFFRFPPKPDPTLQKPPLSDPSPCSHPFVQKQARMVCMICDAEVTEADAAAAKKADYYVRLGYMLKGLRVRKSEIARLSHANTNDAIRNRKMFLVLDLDNTLLEGRNTLKNLKPEDEYLLKQAADPLGNVRDGTLFQFPCLSRLVKLRPFVREFLEQLSPMFEMYLYTAAAPDYTEKMMTLLDPEKKYFSWRVITRADFIHTGLKKDLKLVLGQDRATVILDDNESAWPWHRNNLVPVQRYEYFCPREASNVDDFPSCFFPSVFHQYREDHYTERKMDDEKGKVMLQSILEVLQEIHSQFFDQKISAAPNDVRQVIKRVRGQVLKGCKIFLRLGDNLKSFNCKLKSMGEELGAVFCDELDSSVTHVVTLPENCDEPEKKNISGGIMFMVLPGWIVSSYKSWQRLPEAEYAF